MSTVSPGTEIGQYQVVELKGEGTFGWVYRARDAMLDREVALKVLKPEFVVMEQTLKRFLREAQVLAGFDHPNIVRVYAMGPWERTYYLAMEYVGRSLADEVGEYDIPEMDTGAVTRDAAASGETLDAAGGMQGPTRLSVERALEIVRDMCAGLRAAHERGVIHRDLKPANVLLADDGTAKLCDFGIARVAGRTRLTSMGMMGTEDYSAPEQLYPHQFPGVEVDVRADVYAVCAVLYRLLTGFLPGPAGNALGVRAFAKEVPESLDMAVMRGLSRQPTERQADVANLLADMGPAGSAAEVKEASTRIAGRKPGIFHRLLADLDRRRPAAKSQDTAPIRSEPSALAREPKVSESTEKSTGAGSVDSGGPGLRSSSIFDTRFPSASVPSIPADLRGEWEAHEARLQKLGLEVPRDVPLVVRNERDGGIGLWIPPGDFSMGTEDLGNPERPVHRVYLDGYYLDVCPVTVKQYRRFADAVGREMQPVGVLNVQGDHPVVNVPWEDACRYCEWAGKRLPTEAEWERAARGRDGRMYPWGNEAPDAGGEYRANYDSWKGGYQGRYEPESGAEDGYKYTSPVGSYPNGMSPYGIMDMAGNVSEWCADWYDGNYYQHGPERNPRNDDGSGRRRVVRGGSYNDESFRLLAPHRREEFPGGRTYVGFRCAK